MTLHVQVQQMHTFDLNPKEMARKPVADRDKVFTDAPASFLAVDWSSFYIAII